MTTSYDQLTKDLRDPLVIDVAGTGLNLTGLSSSSPYFNWNEGETVSQTGWIGAGTGLLALETGSGSLSVADLFGPNDPNGFVALQALDSNGDGVINASDPSFANLVVWEDTNNDGVAQSSEIFTMAQLGIVSISLSTTTVNENINGNIVEETAVATLSDGSTREVADVDLAVDPTFTETAPGTTISSAAAALPELAGYGNLPDLRSAMTQDSALLADVQNLISMSPTNAGSFDSAVETAMYEWAGVSGVDPTGDETAVDAQKLAFLEQLYGTSFPGQIDFAFHQQAVLISGAFDAIFDGMKARFLVQDPSSPLSTAFTWNSTSDTIQLTSDFSTAIADLVSAAPTDAATAISYWSNALVVIDQYQEDAGADANESYLVEASLGFATQSFFASSVIDAAATGALTYIDTTAPNGALGTAFNTFDGAAGVNLFDVTTANATLVGEGSGDEFLIGSGAGQLVIYEASSSIFPDNVIQFQPGISESGVTVSAEANGDLVLTIDSSGDTVTLQSMVSNAADGVQAVQFADGTVWNRVQLLQMAGVTSNIYSLSAGDGQMSVNLVGQAFGAAALQLGSGITPADVTFQADAAGDLTVTLTATGDSITFLNDLSNDGVTHSVVSEISYANGEMTNLASIVDGELAPSNFVFTSIGTVSNTNLTSSNWGADLFDLGPGGDTVVAGSGAEQFDFGPGDGQAHIYLNGVSNTLVLGSGITPADVVVSSNSAGDLTLSVVDTSDSVTFVDALGDAPAAGFDALTVEFSDWTSWSAAQLAQMAVTGSASNTLLYGTPGADTFDSQGFATYEQGNGGADTFIYNAGYGQLEINENGGYQTASTAVLQFGAGIDPSQVTLSSDAAGDIFLTDGVTGDQIELDGEKNYATLGATEFGVAQVDFADGTVWTRAQLVAMSLIGSPTNTALYGTTPYGAASTPGVFNSEGYATYAQGVSGADTFIYNSGYGQLEINENTGDGTPSTSILQLGAGITEADLTAIIDSANNVVLTDGVTGDQIKLDGEATNPWSTGQSNQGVAEVEFADGTTMTREQLLTFATTGSPTQTSLNGSTSADVFDSKGYATYEQGNGGADTFIYSTGYGQLEINEDAGYETASTAVLQFGAGITPGEVTVTADAENDIILTDGVSGDDLKLDSEKDLTPLGVSEWGVSAVEFANGTTWSYNQLIGMTLIGSPTNTSLYGTARAGVFNSMGYATYAQGLSGADTFVYNPGYGQLEINENTDLNIEGFTSESVLQLGAGITEANLTATIDSAGDVTLTDGTAGDEIKLDNEAVNLSSTDQSNLGIAEIEFADGTTMTRQQLLTFATTGSPSQTSLYGTSGADVFNSEGYATYEQGNGGADTFVYNPGYGHLEINESSGGGDSTAVLQFGAGIDPSDVTVSANSAGNVILTDGVSGDQITIDGEKNLTITGQNQSGVGAITFANGTTWSYSQLIGMTLIGSPTNTALYGIDQPGVFDSKGYATYAQGVSGEDTFVYNAGYGQLEINENTNLNIEGFTSESVLQLGAGITEANLTVTIDSAGDVILTDGVTGDEIKLDNEANNLSSSEQGNQGVAEIQFADGSTMSRAQLLGDGSSSSPPPPTFALTVGGGQNTIAASALPSTNLQLASNISQSDVILQADNSGDLTILLKATGDSLTITGDLQNQVWGVSSALQTISFASSGAQWTVGESSGGGGSIPALTWIGSSTDTDLIGSDYGANTFVLGTGGDTVTGGNNSDGGTGVNAIDFDKGDGASTVNLNGGTGVLDIAGDVSTSDVLLQADNSGDLTVVLADTGESVTFTHALTDQSWGVQSALTTINFASNGGQESVGTNQYNQPAFTYVGTSTDTDLIGSDYGPNTFYLGAGGDAVTGGNNSDGGTGVNTIHFDQGDGGATVNLNGGTGVLDIASDVSSGDVLLQADNSGDLTIVLADTGQSITFNHDLTDQSWGVASALQTINFASNGGQLSIGTNSGNEPTFTYEGTPTDTDLVGSNYGPNIFVLGAGGDTVTGGNSSDGGTGKNTIYFDGADTGATVNLNGGIGTLNIAADISSNDVLLQADNNGDLTVVLADTGQSITFTHALTDQSWGVASALQTINFASSGAQWTIGTNSGNEPAFTYVGSSTDTNLVGSDYGANSFTLGAGGDTVTGGNSNDGGSGVNTIHFDQGDGGATVNLNGGTGVLDIASDISPNDVLLQGDDSGDLIIVLADTGQSITFTHALTDQPWGVQSALTTINFASNGAQESIGTNQYNQPSFTYEGTSTDTDLVGSDYGPNTFYLGAGGDTVTGGNSSDGGTGVNTIHFDQGDGGATINLNGGTGVLDIASDISPSDVLLQADNSGDLTVVLADTGQTITFTHALTDQVWGVESALQTINLASNGAQWTIGTNQYNQPAFTYEGTSTDTVLVGSDYGPNTFVLGAGGDTVTGGNNSDGGTGVNTIDFDRADGGATINLNGGTGVLDIASDISPSDVLLQADNNGDLTIVLADTGASITFTNDLTEQVWGVSSALQTINFASNGGSMSIGTNQYNQPSFTYVGTSTDTDLVGSNYGPNTFDLGPGNDTVTGGSGANTIEYSSQVGNATVSLNGGTNELDFGSQATDETLWFAQSGNDLQIDVLGSSSSVTISDWFSGSSHQFQEITAGGLKLDSQISQLISAMATFESDNPGFNPASYTQMPSDSTLQSAITAAWHG